MHVFDWERAREIRDGLSSDNPSIRLRAVKTILDLARILAIGVVDAALTRVDRLEARIEKLEKEAGSSLVNLLRSGTPVRGFLRSDATAWLLVLGFTQKAGCRVLLAGLMLACRTGGGGVVYAVRCSPTDRQTCSEPSGSQDVFVRDNVVQIHDGTERLVAGPCCFKCFASVLAEVNWAKDCLDKQHFSDLTLQHRGRRDLLRPQFWRIPFPEVLLGVGVEKTLIAKQMIVERVSKEKSEFGPFLSVCL